ncbi:MAG: UDP-glucose/GDP-mannose dehydrogenase family protein [Bacilli bacterium]
MKIAIVGTGYVGLTSGVCFSELGNEVVCVDVNAEKINQLNCGIMPIYEPGIKELVIKNKENKRLRFTTNLKEAVNRSEIIIIAVGTPSLLDGNVDLSYIFAVANEIGSYINNYKVIVNKSTVPVGTADDVKRIIFNNLVDKKIDFDVASVPEFLKEGSAIKDFFQTERVIIGTESNKARDLLVKLHKPLNSSIQTTDIRSAELIKYAANSFLAMKISFINEIANLAELVGADIKEVARGIGSDSRIGNKFLNAGIGFGGACFPKDTKGLVKIAEQVGLEFSLLQEVIHINERQYNVILDKLKLVIPDLKGKKLAILGLSFKPNTDDMRDAPSISIIRELMIMEPSLTIRAYDPIAIESAKTAIKDNVQYFYTIEGALQDADACIILTEWEQITSFSLDRYKQLLTSPIIIDGRNCFDSEDMDKAGINYLSIGRQNKVYSPL